MTLTGTGFSTRNFSVQLHSERVRRRLLPWLQRTCWWAESDDAPGWFAAADSRDALCAQIIDGLRFHTGDYASAFMVTYR